MSESQASSFIKVTGTAVEAGLTGAGVGVSIATWQDYIAPVAGVFGIILTASMIAHWIVKTWLLKREIEERIRIDSLKAESEISLNSSIEYGINHKERRQRSLSPDQLVKEMLKDKKAVAEIRRMIELGELSIDKLESD